MHDWDFGLEMIPKKTLLLIAVFLSSLVFYRLFKMVVVLCNGAVILTHYL